MVSLHTSVIALGLIVVGLLGDRFSQRFGHGLALQVGVTGSAVMALLLCASPYAWASIGSCALFGLFGGLVPMTVNAVLADVHGRRREIVFTEANALAYVFAIMAPILTGVCVWLGLSWRVAVIAGAVVGIVIALRFFRTQLPEIDRHAAVDSARLPATFWLYSGALGFAVALEFSVLLWAPTYLQQVVGLAPTWAAVCAAAFFVAMLVGRIGGTRLVHFVPARRLFFGACLTTLIGFVAYWSTGEPLVVIIGLFVVGLGIALTFPLLLGFAMNAAASAVGRAATRLMLAPALAILIGPPLLGALADDVGLGLAQLMTPAVAFLMLGGFLAGEAVPAPVTSCPGSRRRALEGARFALLRLAGDRHVRRAAGGTVSSDDELSLAFAEGADQSLICIAGRGAPSFDEPKRGAGRTGLA